MDQWWNTRGLWRADNMDVMVVALKLAFVRAVNGVAKSCGESRAWLGKLLKVSRNIPAGNLMQKHTVAHPRPLWLPGIRVCRGWRGGVFLVQI